MRHVGCRPAPRCRAVRWLQDERGSAFVEFALILPLATALVLGVTSGGSLYNRKLQLTDAVRESARHGATLLPASVSPPATWVSSVRDRAVELSGGTLSSTEVCVKLVREAGATDTNVLASSCPAPMAANEPATPANLGTGECVVKVWGQRSDQLHAGFFKTNPVLKAGAVSRYEGGSAC